MVAILTTSTQNAIENVYFAGGASIVNADLYIGLTTASPGGAGSMTNEPSSTGGYARVSAGTTGTTIFSAATTGILTNANGTITFPTSTAAWSTGATALTYWFAATSATIGSGTMVAYGVLDNPQTVNAATLAPSFPTTDLTLNGSGW